MTNNAAEAIQRETASAWVRPRTLMMLRWIAAGAQAGIIGVATVWFGLQLPLFACGLAISLLIIGNLAMRALHSDNRHLSAREAVLTLAADLCQLALMLGLTGGLNNPFAMLIVVPVTIAATALGREFTTMLGVTTVVLTGIVAVVHLPLRMADGTVFGVPPLYELGFGVSIVLGVVFLSAYALRVATEIRTMGRALSATQLALAREQKLTDLSGVVAAAAHELGTPLATIKLVSAELQAVLSDRPDLDEMQEDVRLISQQADRCRDILRSMGRTGKDDLQMRQVPLGELLREAAEPHAKRGKYLHFEIAPGASGATRQPVVARSPEVVHGLRNLIQNAVDFAETVVVIRGTWTASEIEIEILDDGPGFAPGVLARIGEPFLRARPSAGDDAPLSTRVAGMGLGLFIAKTLLERSGAELFCANAVADQLEDNPPGAIVRAIWPLEAISTEPYEGLGPNQAITP